ncbi:hypothetical protein RQP46_010977 [Phenoliferia psychrophenolica]
MSAPGSTSRDLLNPFLSGLLSLCSSFLLGAFVVHWLADYRTLWSPEVVDSSFRSSLIWYSHFSGAGSWYLGTLGGLCGVAILSTIAKLIYAGVGGMLFDGATLMLLSSALAVYTTNVHAALAFLPLQNPLTAPLDVTVTDALRSIASAHMVVAVSLTGVLSLQAAQSYSERRPVDYEPMLPLSLALTAFALLPASLAHLPPSIPGANVHRRSSSSTESPALPQKQDNVFFSKEFTSPSFLANVVEQVAENAQLLAAALLAGKADPAFPLNLTQIILPNLKKRAGWLVLESYMTPSLFDAVGNSSAVDEYTYCQSLGYNEALNRLQAHWSSWIVEADIAAIAAAGLNTVRIPIGYWAFDISGGEPYVQGQYPWLLTAIGWCQTHGIRVLVDVHGAPGSQNGFDNSGRRGAVTWHTNDLNVKRTIAVVHTLATEFAKPQYNGIVTSLQLLNEPAGFYSPDLLSTYKNFAYDAYSPVRYPTTSSTASPVTLSLHDAFESLESWTNFMPTSSFPNVNIDTHIYTIFTEDGIAMSQADRIQSICSMRPYLAKSQGNLWTTVGEWSAATTDCAVSLNGRGIGSRY